MLPNNTEVIEMEKEEIRKVIERAMLNYEAGQLVSWARNRYGGVI
jgi:hypothetical protein